MNMDELLTTKQAARALFMTHGALRNAIAAGRVAVVTIGDSNRHFVTRAEVERYRRERRPAGRPRITKDEA